MDRFTTMILVPATIQTPMAKMMRSIRMSQLSPGYLYEMVQQLSEIIVTKLKR